MEGNIIYESAYVTVDGTTTSWTWNVPKGLECPFYLQFGNISSLTGVLTVSYDDGSQYVNIVSVTSAGTAVAAGGTVTAADGLKLHFDAMGATNVRFTRSAGSGPLKLASDDDASGLNAARLLQLIASGITVSGGATLAEQQTQTTHLSNIATGGNLREVDVTFTVDNANALDANDVGAGTDIIAACVSANDANGWLVGFYLLDGDDNTAAGMNVYFFSANTSLGTIDAAISISDANAFTILGVVPIASGDWIDIINAKCVTKTAVSTGLPLPITPASGTDDIYVAIQVLGTPTFTTGSLKGRFFFKDAR